MACGRADQTSSTAIKWCPVVAVGGSLVAERAGGGDGDVVDAKVLLSVIAQVESGDFTAGCRWTGPA